VKPITLNLASRPFRNNNVVGSVLGTAAAAIVLATSYNLYIFLNYGGSYAELQRQERESRARLATLDAEERKLAKEIEARDFRRAYDRGRFASELILKRSFSWTLLFNKLEAVVPREVMMTAIRPNIGAKGIEVHVQGVAKNHGGLIAFEEALQGNPAFGNAYPINERRLNPSRPEIAFALKFDYLPRKAAPPEAVVASTGGAGRPASAGATASQAIAHAVAATPTGQDARKPEQPPAAKETVERKQTLPPVGTVGRSGRPVPPEILARVVAAPGGAYLPPPPAEDPPRGRDSKGKARAGASPPASPPAQDASPAGRSAATGAVSRVSAGGVPPSAAPAMSGSAAAVRLDVPLAFSSQPVGEAYDALARAYGVRFLIDAGVDRTAKVTADLGGKRLSEAIAALAGAAGHRVTRQQDGRYRVVVDGGAPIADKPIREENLPQAEVRP
jgi:hypothetical protein